MKKHVIISTNGIAKYMYYVPLTVWAWRYFGWEPTVMFPNWDNTIRVVMPHDTTIAKIPRVNGYESSTVAQVSRLYGCCITNMEPDAYIMTGDVDLLPLSDYWKPNFNDVTTYGRDLTDYHYPMCFIGMNFDKWFEVMQITTQSVVKMTERDLDEYYPKAKNKWCVDQDIITDRLLKYGKEKITHVNRGIDPKTNYPIGRVDRSAWSLDHRQYIDAHLPHDVLTNEKSFHNVMQLLHTVWPKEDWKWMLNYHKEFKKLL